MKANRKADLQRKLSIAPVPKPPAGLAERIKNDIPKELQFDAESERERIGSSIAFSMRVAASILILVSIAFLGMNVLSRSQTAPAVAPAAAKIDTTTPTAVAQSQPESGSVFGDQAREVDAFKKVEDLPPPKPQRAKDRPILVAHGRKEAAGSTRPDEKKKASAEGTATGAIGEMARLAPPPAAIAPPPPASIGESVTITAEAPVLQAAAQQTSNSARMEKQNKTAMADSMVVARDASAGADDRRQLSVQRFAAPVTLPASAMVADIEAVTSPFDDGRTYVRVSVDSGIVARDVRADVLLSGDLSAVRWLAGSWRWQSALVSRQSTTSLAEVTVTTTADAQVAVVRVHYRERESGDEETIEKSVRRGDIKPWSDASRRTKATVLAAKSAEPGMRDKVITVARAAGLEELAAEVEKR